MRGKQKQMNNKKAKLRITPADAGKTAYMGRGHSRTRDHPRGCGENLNSKVYPPHQKGSPPRMRGKLNYGDLRTYIRRITPADAGKTHSELATLF